MRQWWLRTAVCLAALATVLIVWHTVQVPWWDNAADIQEMLDNQHDGIGNEGTDEYVPAGADPYDVDQKAPLVRFDGNGPVQINIQQWLSERRKFTVNADAPGTLVLRLFNFPSWKVRVNGTFAETRTTPHSGQIVIPIPGGNSTVEVDFVQGWDRRVGMVSSGIAILALIITEASRRRKAAPVHGS
jgi:hypothetical protein